MTDGTPGGKVKLYGDLKSTASYAEKTVGFTWSDPGRRSAGQRADDDRRHRRVGLLPRHRDADPARAGGPKAGNALYLLER